MSGEPFPEPTLWDETGAPETVYLTRVDGPTTEDGWLVPSIDVGTWRPLAVGDRLVGLDKHSSDEFLVEVMAIDGTGDEVFYSVKPLADLDPEAYPGLNDTRSWRSVNHGERPAG